MRILSFLIACLIGINAAPFAQATLKEAATTEVKQSKEAETAAKCATIYERAWRLIKDNYCHRDKLQAWAEWEHKFDGKLNSKEALSSALNDLVGALGDEFTYVLEESDLKAREKRVHQKKVVTSKMMPGEVAYIKIQNFMSDNLLAELESALLTNLKARAYVLDLRDNPGGYIESAFKAFQHMADAGVFMSYTGYQNGLEDAELFAINSEKETRIMEDGQVSQERLPNLTGQKPIIVLVNKDTRSAAEMLAAALKESRGALLVGGKTFGKGVLQDTYPLDEKTSLKVVTAEYLTPHGNNIHGKGIEPDLKAPDSAAFETAVQTAYIESNQRPSRAIARETRRPVRQL